MVKQYGPITGLKLGKVKLVVVSSKELIKEVSVRSEFEGRPDGYFWRLRSQGERFGKLTSSNHCQKNKLKIQFCAYRYSVF